MVDFSMLPKLDLPTIELPKTISGSGGHTFIDGDTLMNEEGNLLRIQGLSAPEIQRLMDSGYMKPGTPGGLEAYKQIEKLAEEFGYNNVQYLTNDDGSPMMDATGSRQLVRLVDDKGRDFTETLSRYDINKLSKFSTNEEIDKYRLGMVKRSTRNIRDPLNEYEKSSLILNDAIKSEQWYDTQFAKAAFNEQELSRLNADRQPGESLAAFAFRKKEAAKYSKVRVQQRNTDRDIENKSLHPWSESFDVGWQGVIESLYGAAELLGYKTGFNWLENLGERGIKRQREYLSTKPDLKLSVLKPVLDPDGNIITNEWDINGLGEFFEYMGNMTAVSLPYMGVTAAGALTAPIGGMAAPASMYTGMTWNDMEGENKDKSATLAVAGGLTMTVLDRLGIKLLMSNATGTLLNNKYRGEMVKAFIQKNPGSTEQQARAAIAQMTRKAAAELTGDAAKVAKEQLKYGNIIRSFAARAGVGFFTESVTEVGQELAQYLASTVGSDKEFDSVELHERLINAFVAGGTLGSAFSVPGTAYDVGQWTDINVRQLPNQEKLMSQEQKWHEEENKDLHDRYVEGDQIPAGKNVGDIKPGGRFAKGKSKSIEDNFNKFRKDALKRDAQFRRRQRAQTTQIQTLENQLADPGIPANEKAIIQIRLNELQALQAREGADRTSFQDKVEAGKKQYKARDYWETFKDAANNLPVLWRGGPRHFFWKDSFGAPTLRKMAGGIGSYLRAVHTGQTLENFKQNKLTEFKNDLGRVTFKDKDGNDVQEEFSEAAVAKALGYKNINKIKISEDIYEFYRLIKQTPWRDIQWDTLPAKFQADRVFYESIARRFKFAGNSMYEQQKNARTKFDDGSSTGKKWTAGRIENYLGTFRSIDKAMVEKNRDQFIKDLQEEKNYTYEEAVALADAILNNNDIVDEVSLMDFNVGRGIHIPGQLKKRTLNMAENEVLNKYLEKDLFINISNAAKAAARYITYQKYVGDNAEIFNEALEQTIGNKEYTREKANFAAAFIQDYLDGESGNYKKISNPQLANLQRNLLIWTTMAGLPMATISSFVEYMMILRALSPEQINDVLKFTAKEFANAIWETMTTATPNMKLATSTEGQLAKERRQARLKRLGYFTWDTGAAQTTGATENTFASRYLLDKYFRIILLQQWTDITRNIRGAIADDFIMDHLRIIKNQRDGDTLYTNEVQESEEQLRNLGIRVEELLEIDNLPFDKPADMSREDHLLILRDGNRRLDEIFRNAEFNFINEAIALPGTANRPLFYQNPHLALFTQFQGFISTFSATIIPRLWGDYIKRGTPALKYNAFAIMTTMIALGFVSQYLKDLLKYGQGSPYLDQMEKFQRGVGSSGMLGVAERPLNFFFPIYETSSSNIIEAIFDTGTGEAAALSNLSRAATGAGQVLKGSLMEDASIEPGVYKLLKTTPGVGPFNQFNRWTAAKISAIFE